MTKCTILFLSASSHVTYEGGLGPQVRRGALDHAASAIHKVLKGSGYRDRFELVTRWAAEPHFSGHGGRVGDRRACRRPSSTSGVSATVGRVGDLHPGGCRGAALSVPGDATVLGG
jgi:hypothetical protein